MSYRNPNILQEIFEILASLREITQSISCCTELAASETKNKKVLKYLAHIQKNTERLRTMVSDENEKTYPYHVSEILTYSKTTHS